MKKKVLIVASIVKRHIIPFHIPVLKMFKEMEWETTVAARNDYENPEECVIPYCDNFFDIPIVRCPFSPGNLKAYKKLKKVVNEGNYDIVYCHSPIGSVLTRLAARPLRKNGMRVFYMAHGFHFFKGASLINWIFYYPIEKLCSYFTDVLITMNNEDFERAKKRFKAKKVVLVNGVGVPTNKITDVVVDKVEMRSSMGLKPEDVVLISVGELRKLKNHKVIIEAMSLLENDNIHYIIVGDGDYEQELLDFAKKKNLEKRVHLTGFRKNVGELLKMSDIFCFPSLREGLPLALMEAMAAGLPAVVSDIRGNRDLVDDNLGGFLYRSNDCQGFAEGIAKIIESPELKARFGNYNREKIKNYDVDIVVEELKKLYF